MAKCMYCGMELINYDTHNDCRNCEKLHKQDMQNRHFPPGFIYREELEEAGWDQIELSKWKRLKYNSNSMRAVKEQTRLDELLIERDEIVKKINYSNGGRAVRAHERVHGEKANLSKVELY